jgi:hypothetical protein
MFKKICHIFFYYRYVSYEDTHKTDTINQIASKCSKKKELTKKKQEEKSQEYKDDEKELTEVGYMDM